MTAAEHRTQTDLTQAVALPGAGVHAPTDPVDRQIARIRRLGKQLFEVADCIVILRHGTLAYPHSHAPCSAETDFCQSLPQPGSMVIVQDTRLDESFGMHRRLAKAASMRFYAALPIRDPENRIVGSISLVDRAPRHFSHTARALFADLAALIERELQLQSVVAAQLTLQKKNKSLRRKSLIDPLLGTWNRSAIMRILTIEAIRCDKQGLPLSLIVVDLDFFKQINDTHGHPAGDAVLVQVAGRLRSCVQSQQALGRYGGEEFLAVLPGADIDAARAVAERMRESVSAKPETIGDAVMHLTISPGIASTVLFPTATTDELISRADMALYAAKDAGRNCVMQAMPGHA